jgi:hypothetical protein
MASSIGFSSVLRLFNSMTVSWAAAWLFQKSAPAMRSSIVATSDFFEA